MKGTERPTVGLEAVRRHLDGLGPTVARLALRPGTTTWTKPQGVATLVVQLAREKTPRENGPPVA